MVNECVISNQFIAGIGVGVTQDDLSTSTTICSNGLQSEFFIVILAAIFCACSLYFFKIYKK